MRISTETYTKSLASARTAVENALRDPKIAEVVKKARDLSPTSTEPSKKWSMDHPLVKAAGRALMKAQAEALSKVNPPGIGTWVGFNFYDLRGPAYFIFPLLTPFIQMIPRRGKVNAGVGTVAHWKATRNPNSNYIYAGVQEGQRNATATPNEVDYLATYKELGMEGGNTFTSQWSGEGFTDNLADEHFRNLARLRLQEEMMTLLGNSGTATGNLGFQLGQAPNVTATLALSDTFNSPATAGLPTNTNVSACVVAITGMGINPGGQAGYQAPPTVATGLTPTSTRTNVDGTTLAVNGGTSAISNVSSAVITNATAKWVTLTCAAVKGAVAYAWYISTTNTTTVADTVANCLISGITPGPKFVVGQTAAASGGTQRGNATGLSTDFSSQVTDFDGLLTYAFQNGLWTDMAGGTLTPLGNGQVKEVEADLQFLWNQYQAQPDAIWCSADVRAALDAAIIYSSTGTNSYIFGYQKDGQGSLLGGFLVSAYKSKYSINAEGGAAIPIRLHPMLPPGTLYYDINTNPYPHSRVPAVREFLMQRDYYAIEWPIVTREWTYGTYVQEVLAHYMPWISAIRTGIGQFVAPCWIAAVCFNEDFFTGPRVNLVRNYLLNWESKSGLGKIVVGLYRLHGKKVAEMTKKSSVMKKFFSSIFNGILKKAEATA
jgi:hypothetical protein